MNIDDRIKQAARALAIRAQCRDQNAMAMLAQCRDIAKRADGSEQCRRATITVEEAYRYAVAHPPRQPVFSGDGPSRETLVMGRAIQIANTRQVTEGIKPLQSVVLEEASKFPEGPLRTAFSVAWQAPLSLWGNLPQDAVAAGRALGLACRLQAVRNGGPIGLISREAEWELGA